MRTKEEQLEIIYNKCKNCTQCKLHTTRKNIVVGEGNINADIMFIGEGPGKTEDEMGKPFVGESGKLLDILIQDSLQMNRSDVYICNVVKCRPTKNMLGEKDRPPDEEEVAACMKYLLLQIAIIKPKIVVTVGNVATRFLINTDDGITKIHGIPIAIEGVDYKIVPVYHPSYIKRNGGIYCHVMKEARDDMAMIKNMLQKIKNDTRM